MSNTIIWAELDEYFECPKCAEPIKIFSAVNVSNAVVTQTSDGRKSGPAEYGAEVETQVLGVNIEHNCVEWPVQDEDEEGDAGHTGSVVRSYNNYMRGPRPPRRMVR